MTQWGLDVLFNPGKRHMDEEKLRLQSTREEAGDASNGKRIDLAGGKVTIRRGGSAAATESTDTDSPAESSAATDSTDTVDGASGAATDSAATDSAATDSAAESADTEAEPDAEG